MENKSIGGALVDVFDAGVSLIKSEITAITRRLGNIARAKGLGVVLLLAALVPLTLALIFLILFVFYGLMRLGLGAWAAALIMGLVSLLVTAALIFVALKKLGGEVPDDSAPPAPLSDIAKDDLKYGYTGSGSGADAAVPPQTGPSTPGSAARSSSAPALSGVLSSGVGLAAASPVSSGGSSSGDSSSGGGSSDGSHGGPAHTTGGHVVQDAPSPIDDAQRGGPQSTSTLGKPTQERASREAEQTGIPVSTHPTYPEDMKKEGY
ncbi:phage holin family protein [Deinococcus sp.]|uniref:phage holin family protein n=1 Tax=Deinococcus sp. TaxID=47478 RepID=UPI00286EA2A0|nr:phage holin family protein [Deinococcus sp.]